MSEKFIRLRVRPGYVVNHRDPQFKGPISVGWQKLGPGERFRARPAVAKRLVEQGAARQMTRTLRWPR